MTNASGIYELSLVLKDYANLHFFREGYRQKQLPVRAMEVNRDGEIRLDAQLTRQKTLAQVAGIVSDRQGQAIPGEQVKLVTLRSGQRYQTATDDRGGFRLAGVEVGGDYYLSIRPRGPYRDYKQSDIVVTADEWI